MGSSIFKKYRYNGDSDRISDWATIGSSISSIYIDMRDRYIPSIVYRLFGGPRYGYYYNPRRYKTIYKKTNSGDWKNVIYTEGDKINHSKVNHNHIVFSKMDYEFSNVSKFRYFKNKY